MLLYFLILLPVLYLLGGAYLYFRQGAFLYHPMSQTQQKYPNISMKNDGETINIIVLNEGQSKAILYFGGNAESMSESADYIAAQFPKFTVYLMDYRGYGRSSGVSSEKAYYSDALKLYDMVKKNHTDISVGGRSLGSAVAVYLASQRDVAKLALITPFDSIVNVAQARYPFYPVSFLLRDTFDVVDRVKEISAPTFIVFAQQDQVIPRIRTEKLIEAFPKTQLKIDMIKNRGHADISSDERYYRIMQDFIGEIDEKR